MKRADELVASEKRGQVVDGDRVKVVALPLEPDQQAKAMEVPVVIG